MGQRQRRERRWHPCREGWPVCGLVLVEAALTVGAAACQDATGPRRVPLGPAEIDERSSEQVLPVSQNRAVREVLRPADGRSRPMRPVYSDGLSAKTRHLSTTQRNLLWPDASIEGEQHAVPAVREGAVRQGRARPRGPADVPVRDVRAAANGALYLGLLWLPLPRRHHRPCRAVVSSFPLAVRGYCGTSGRTRRPCRCLDGLRLGPTIYPSV